jgi:hypothetical protein
MISLNKHQIDTAIPKVKVGLEKYLWLQNEVLKRDVSTDRDFQRRFNAFYRVRRNTDWQKDFYKLLELNKKREISLEEILISLYKKVGRVEASFASKLVATINPKKPVIDKIVFNNLGLKLPTANTKNRSAVIIEQYEKLAKEFVDFLQTENGKYLVDQFVKNYPQSKLSKVKMLDLILWQTRD